jgi:hypothetical protein
MVIHHMRIWDAVKISNAVKLFLKSENKVDVIEWLSNPDNIVLENDKGDIALFEKGVKNYYSGHYYFKSRGKEAKESGKELLDELFNTCYNIHMVLGMVPITHLGARWMSKALRFKSYGVIKHDGEWFELFILTKKEFNE